jgi:hypothetical protein
MQKVVGIGPFPERDSKSGEIFARSYDRLLCFHSHLATFLTDPYFKKYSSIIVENFAAWSLPKPLYLEAQRVLFTLDGMETSIDLLRKDLTPLFV